MYTSKKAAGMWLAAASLLMVAALVFHGPIDPEPSAQMDRIAEAALRWTIVHWAAAAALSMYALVGLVVLTSASLTVRDGWTFSAWAVLPIGALWTLATAVAEATVVTDAAVLGSGEVFSAWWAFAEGMANGFAVVALAVAVIAVNDARSRDSATPRWAAWSAAAAGLASFSGWILGMWFEITAGNFLWVISSILMCVWTFWLGAAWIRSASGHPVASPEYAA